MQFRSFSVFYLLTSVVAQAANPALERQFQQTVRPFLTKYCMGCHSGEMPAAQFDLKPYTSIESVARDYPRWALVHEKLTAKEMPPKQLPQPPVETVKQVNDWITAVRNEEARKNAGDPGPVLVRRLSNSEYNYTIRDLTGVDIRPTREFPVDPANPSGFDNSGESLTMSPALLNKYLQAAREVANHMVLTQDGIDFSPNLMLVETDREKYAIMRIVNFYARQPTDYADYFQAAWRYKHRVALKKPAATLASIATEAKISAKYLPMIWAILEEQKDVVGPIAKLQGMWRALSPPAESQPEELRAKCVEMRDFADRVRQHTSMQFTAPVVKGLSAYSPPLINWKHFQYATHRRNFDPSTLVMETDPPLTVPTIPRYPGLGQESAVRWAALHLKARIGDPDLVVPTGQRPQYEAAFARLANVFPDHFYVRERGRFFPDDSQDKGRYLSAGYHNVMGYFRDDNPLMELILDDKGIKELNRLWDEFDFIGDYTMRTYTQYYFNQSGEVLGLGRESGRARPADKPINAEEIIFKIRDEYAAKAEASDNPIGARASMDHFQRVNKAIRAVEQMRAKAEPFQLEALTKFAARAYRRPITKLEHDNILAFYRKLRDKGGLSHEDAVRDSIVSVLMSPDFCYRVDLTDARATTRPSAPLSSYALASRLSYFLWSSMPDQELLNRAAAGDLLNPRVLVAQARRMLKDERAQGLATEFTGNLFDFRRFEQISSVDRTRFPTFTNELRQAMFEEPLRFITDLIRGNGSVLDILYGKHTFVNPVLAKHYGMPEMKAKPDEWTRIDDATQYGRGGLLPMSAFLTQNSPGLRTSPVKRGYWVARRVLGETIPPPPPSVPELPQDEAKSEMTLREALAKHRENAACAGCHARFDSFGLVFENYGPIGETRTKDLAGRAIDTSAEFPRGGGQGSGLEAVQKYIHEHRESDFLDNVSRKMLSYSLGRSLLISDEPLIDRMVAQLTADRYRMGTLVETIVTSPQFLNKRGPESALKLAQNRTKGN